MYDVKYLLQMISIILALCVTGCSSDRMMLKKRIDYHSNSDNIAAHLLEVPPDLTALPNHSDYTLPRGGTALNTLEQNSTKTEGVLPTNDRVKLVKAGNQRWLVVQGSAEKVWPEIRDFWISSGFSLTVDNPVIGIMETDWKENRAQLPQDWFSRMLNKISTRLMSTGELDKYRTRIERDGHPDTTNIYVTHRGMQEVYRSTGTGTGPSNSDAVTRTVWEPRQPDPELEVQMLGLLMEYLGYDQETVQATLTAPAIQQNSTRIVGAGQDQTLEIFDSFDRTWRRVGLAIENAGYVITDRNRAEGIYYARQADQDIDKEEDPTIFSRLSFWRKKSNSAALANQPEFDIQLKQESGRTRLMLVSKNAAADPEIQQRLLENLAKQLE